MEGEDGWLLSKLHDDSRGALKRLCDEGCDRNTLLEHLAWLASTSEPVVLPAIDPVTGKRVRSRDRQIGPRDSWRRLLDGMSPKRLETIKARTEDLAATVERLSAIPLVAILRNEGRFGPHGLLGSQVPVVRTVFNDLLILPDLAREYGPGTTHAYTRILKNVYLYIHTNTGRWHDREMVPILCDLTTNHPTEDYLKKWRAGHDLKQPRPARRGK